LKAPAAFVPALMRGFVAGVCHADAVGDLIFGAKVAAPLPISPEWVPGSLLPAASIILPSAQTKSVPAARRYVDAEVAEGA